MSISPAFARTSTPGFPEATDRERMTTVAIVGLLTLLAFLLRLSQLRQSLVADEALSTYTDIFAHSFRSVISTVHTGGENSPPLYFILAWLSAKLGDPTVWIRLPSLLLSTATVPVMYLLGRSTVGRATGLVSAGIVALSPFMLWYGVEARPYATMMFFVAASTLAVVRAVATHARGWWLLYTLCIVGAAYSHYTSIFVLGFQTIWAMWMCRDRLREPILATALASALYLPWVPHLRGKQLNVIGGLYPLSVGTVARDVTRLIPGHPSAPLSEIPTVLGLIAIGGCVLLALVHLVRGHGFGTLRTRVSPQLVLLIGLALATPVGLVTYSLLVTDLFLPRGLIASGPAAALVLAALLTSLPRPLTVAAVAVVLFTLAVGTSRSVFDSAYQRPLYRDMAGYLDRVAGPQDPVILATYAGSQPIAIQLQEQHPIVSGASVRVRRVEPGHNVYLVFDEAFARLLHVRVVRMKGFRIVFRRHYGGSLPADVLTYRREALVPSSSG